MMRLLIFASVASLFGVSLANSADTTASVDPFQLSKDPAAHVWRFRNLVGTPTKISRTLNSEVAHFAQAVRDDEQDINEITREIEGEKRGAVKRLQNFESYQNTKADFDTATADLMRARAEHNSSLVVSATNRLNQAKSQIDRMETNAVASTRQIRVDEDYLARLRYHLPEVRKNLEEAKGYRTELVDALWNSFMLEWPLRQGSRGILREVTPTHVSSDGSFTATFAAFEPLSDGGEKEGITTTHGIRHPVTVLILNCGDLSPKAGASIGIYRTLEVTDRHEFGDGTTYVLTPVSTDFDALAEAIAAPIDASATQPTTSKSN
jgi:hypothetical protein